MLGLAALYGAMELNRGSHEDSTKWTVQADSIHRAIAPLFREKTDFITVTASRNFDSRLRSDPVTSLPLHWALGIPAR